MSRRKAAQRPRRGAEAGPDATASNRAASRVDASTTARNDRAQLAAAADPLTDAEVLVGSTSWLLSLADWLAEEIDLADGETIRLGRADVERMRAGLTRCVACLDTLACEPAQLPPLDDASSEATPFSDTPSHRMLQ